MPHSQITVLYKKKFHWPCPLSIVSVLDVSISAVSRVFYTPILQTDREIYFDDMLYSQINTAFFSNIDQDTYASLM